MFMITRCRTLCLWIQVITSVDFALLAWWQIYKCKPEPGVPAGHNNLTILPTSLTLPQKFSTHETSSAHWGKSVE